MTLCGRVAEQSPPAIPPFSLLSLPHAHLSPFILPSSIPSLPPTEPGYYEDGEFGVRIENIVQIVPAETKVPPGSYIICMLLADNQLPYFSITSEVLGFFRWSQSPW